MHFYQPKVNGSSQVKSSQLINRTLLSDWNLVKSRQRHGATVLVWWHFETKCACAYSTHNAVGIVEKGTPLYLNRDAAVR